MTPDEAKKIARVALTADGNCDTCAVDLLGELWEAFPEVDWANAIPPEEDYVRKSFERLVIECQEWKR